MATAINFNWLVCEKMTNGKIYDFIFTDEDENATPLTIAKNGESVTISTSGGRAEVVNIFRANMRVIDAIAIAIKRAGRVTSGEVYRAELLREFSADYETAQVYESIHFPSFHFVPNMPRESAAYYLGFELETAGRNENCEKALEHFTSNVWRMVSDVSIAEQEVNGRRVRFAPRGCSGIEFVSTLIHPNDAVKAEFFEPFCTMLTGLAISKKMESTGLHCHISRSAFGDSETEQDENISKLVFMENYILSDAALESVFGRPSGRWAKQFEPNDEATEYAAKLAKRAPKVLNEESVRAVMIADLLHGNKSRSGHDYGVDRYRKINITNQQTVEFRQGKGNINSKALALIAQHACTIAKYCRETTWAKLSANGYYKSIPTSNKYADLRRIFAPQTEE